MDAKAVAPLASRLGEKQTIPARHGVATFLPKGHLITIVNTYGSQVVDTWAFALGAPPTEDDTDEEENRAQAALDGLRGRQADFGGESTSRSATPRPSNRSEDPASSSYDDDGDSESPESVKSGTTNATAWSMLNDSKTMSPPAAGSEAGNPKKSWSSYIPSIRGKGKPSANKDKAPKQGEEEQTEAGKSESSDQAGKSEQRDSEDKHTATGSKDQSSGDKQVDDGDIAEKQENAKPETTEPKEDENEAEAGKDSAEQANGQKADEEELAEAEANNKGTKKGAPDAKKGENQGADKKTAAKTKAGGKKSNDEKAENMSKSWSSYLPKVPSVRSTKKSNEAQQGGKESKGWGAYLPTGHGYTAYLPTKSQMSAFMTMPQRDQSKSYAEQLYDFSKTPVGAASLSVASGSGYASSLYAAYSAYSTAQSALPGPASEYLSMPHTRAAILRRSPKAGDSLVSNLQAPLMTLVEDTSCGVHDTLMPACDPIWYKQSGVTKWEEHGSCAENLVMALNQLNQQAKLKGRRAIGADVSVNVLPSPLNLFMAVTMDEEGVLSLNSPKPQKGAYVKLRAERDLVIVMSACPEDVKGVNGKKPMAAHFLVESPSEEDMKEAAAKEEEAQKIIRKAQARSTSSKTKSATASKPKTTPTQPTEEKASKSTATAKAKEEKASKAAPPKARPAASREPSRRASAMNSATASPKPEEAAPANPAKPPATQIRKKPKKLEVRSASARTSSPATPTGKAA